MPESVIKWVEDVPKRRPAPGRPSRWAPVVTQLAENPGRSALVAVEETTERAEVVRGSLIAHARGRGIKLGVYVRDTSVYAVVKGFTEPRRRERKKK